MLTHRLFCALRALEKKQFYVRDTDEVGTQTIRSIVGFGVKTPKKSLFEVFGLCVYRLFVQSVPVWFTSFCLPLSCALFSLFARVAV